MGAGSESVGAPGTNSVGSGIGGKSRVRRYS